MGHRWPYKAPTTQDHGSSGATRPKLLTDVTIRSKSLRDPGAGTSATPPAARVPSSTSGNRASGRGRGWTGARAVFSLDCMVSQHVAAGYPPAPVDPGGLAETLRPFGESRMLPRAAYTDPAVFEWERRNFFGGGWMCVARG